MTVQVNTSVAGGGSGGGGIVVAANHIFADNAARDTYFTAHPTEKIAGTYILSGVQYELWTGSTWQNVDAVVTGPAGTAGTNGTNGTNGAAGAAGPGYLATSATSLATGVGTKAFTTQAGLAYTVGARARASSRGTTDWMEGVVSVYSGTGLTIVTDVANGSGTHTDWDINIAGVPGATGAAGDVPIVTAFDSVLNLNTAGGGRDYGEHDMTGDGTVVFDFATPVDFGNAIVCLIGSGNPADAPDWATNFFPDDYTFVSTLNARNIYYIAYRFGSALVSGRRGADAGGGGPTNIWDELWTGAASDPPPVSWNVTVGSPVQNGSGRLDGPAAFELLRNGTIADGTFSVTLRPDNHYPYVYFRSNSGGTQYNILVIVGADGKIQYHEHSGGVDTNTVTGTTVLTLDGSSVDHVLTVRCNGTAIDFFLDDPTMAGTPEISATAAVGLTNTYVGLGWAGVPASAAFNYGETKVDTL